MIWSSGKVGQGVDPVYGPYYTFIAQFGERHDDFFNPENSCRPRANWAINCLLYRKLKYHVIRHRVLCRETYKGDTTSRGRHEDFFALHVTSLDQSHFFIRHINYMRYNNTESWPPTAGGWQFWLDNVYSGHIELFRRSTLDFKAFEGINSSHLELIKIVNGWDLYPIRFLYSILVFVRFTVLFLSWIEMMRI